MFSVSRFKKERSKRKSKSDGNIKRMTWEVACEGNRYISTGSFVHGKCCGYKFAAGEDKLVRVRIEVMTSTGLIESWWAAGAICPKCQNFIAIPDYQIPWDTLKGLPRIVSSDSAEFASLSDEEKKQSAEFFKTHKVCSPV